MRKREGRSGFFVHVFFHLSTHTLSMHLCVCVCVCVRIVLFDYSFIRSDLVGKKQRRKVGGRKNGEEGR